MAHFAEIDENNTVLRVLVVGDDQEHRGQDFLSIDLQLGGTWIQCSYNHRIRKQYPAVGYTYDPVNDVFIEPKPFESWILNENFEWDPPVPFPGVSDTGFWSWDEDQVDWIFTSFDSA